MLLHVGTWTSIVRLEYNNVHKAAWQSLSELTVYCEWGLSTRETSFSPKYIPIYAKSACDWVEVIFNFQTSFEVRDVHLLEHKIIYGSKFRYIDALVVCTVELEAKITIVLFN